MTNFEWLMRNDMEMLKRATARSMSVKNGIPGFCVNTRCCDCEFAISNHCHEHVKNWLDEEYKPLYKKGDIVIDSSNQIFVVKEACGDDGYIKTSCYADDWCGRKIHITEIKKKVGHIEESEV